MTKPLSAAERAFVAGAIDGAIDLNDLSDETRTAMKAGGLSVATLGKIADTDTRIDTFEEVRKLYGKGVDERGRAYYEFRDPGNLGDLGRFYVDPGTGKLFKSGKTAADGVRYARDMQYEVSQVRRYRDMP